MLFRSFHEQINAVCKDSDLIKDVFVMFVAMEFLHFPLKVASECTSLLSLKVPCGFSKSFEIHNQIPIGSSGDFEGRARFFHH